MSDTLSQLTDELSKAEKQLSDLNSQLTALQTDPNIAALKATMSQVYTHYGNAPWNKNGQFAWQDSGGTFWIDATSNSEFLSARSQIANNASQISAVQGQILTLQDPKNPASIPSITNTIANFDAKDPGAQAAAAATLAAANAQANATTLAASAGASQSKTILIAGVVIVLIAAVVFILHERKVKAI